MFGHRLLPKPVQSILFKGTADKKSSLNRQKVHFKKIIDRYHRNNISDGSICHKHICFKLDKTVIYTQNDNSLLNR